MTLLSGKVLCTLQGVTVLQYPDGLVEFTADADIDADGSPHAYHPISSKGLDDLRNAGRQGNWFGIETDNGKPDGTPIVQGLNDPAPGYYVSATKYQRAEFPHTDPRRYLDSEKIPFIVIEGYIRKRAKGIVLGSRAVVTNERTGLHVEAMVGDIGPLTKIGELSIAAAKAIGIPSNPRTGGEEAHVITYELWPGDPAEINGERFNLIPAF